VHLLGQDEVAVDRLVHGLELDLFERGEDAGPDLQDRVAADDLGVAVALEDDLRVQVLRQVAAVLGVERLDELADEGVVVGCHGDLFWCVLSWTA
jgi:hypothetical protein